MHCLVISRWGTGREKALNQASIGFVISVVLAVGAVVCAAEQAVESSPDNVSSGEIASRAGEFTTVRWTSPLISSYRYISQRFSQRISSLDEFLRLCNPILLEVLTPPRNNAHRRMKLLNLLKAGGCSADEISMIPVRTVRDGQENVLLKLAGTVASGKSIIIACHTDFIGNGAGAVDNWSGAVMLAALHRYFRKEPLKHRLVFVAFASEEHGSHGSRQFVNRMSRKERSDIRAVVNLECLGVDAPRTWVNHSSDQLEDLFFQAAKELKTKVFRQVLFDYSSDAASFEKVGIPSVTIHSIAPASLKILNSPDDNPEVINMLRYSECYRLLVRYIKMIDQADGKVEIRDRDRRLRPVPRTLYWSASESGKDVVSIDRVEWASREYRAGLRRGDQLIGIADHQVKKRKDILPVLQTRRRGTPLELTLLRDGKEILVSILY